MKSKYLTVSALTRYLKRKIEMDSHLQEVWLKGEISNFNHHSRGHMYLTIKDDNSRIQAVMFAGNNRHLKFTPENGMNVLIQGNIGVFEPYGNYQLYIKNMEPDGIGALYLAYEQLKEKLHRAGYFDAHHKRPIPKFPQHIAIITSPTGAAVRDIITTIERRYPIVQLTVIPVLVQGEGAAESIKQAIEYACKSGKFDTIIVGRGGGSIEDLWCFNDVQVVEAIFKSTVPVISAIGHETDTTISDYVSDLRAATPTGAAELAVPSLMELQDTVLHLKVRLSKLTQFSIMKKTEILQSLRKSYAFHFPKQLLNEKEQYIDRLNEKLQTQFLTIQQKKRSRFDHQLTRLYSQHPSRKVSEAVEKVDSLKKQSKKYTISILNQKQEKLLNVVDKLTLVNPLYIMKRGFALPYDKNGKIIKSTTEVSLHEEIKVKVTDGSIYCKVKEVRRASDE